MALGYEDRVQYRREPMPHGLALPPTPAPISLHICLNRTRNAFAGRLPVAALVARNCLQHRNEAVTGLVKAGLEVHSLEQQQKQRETRSNAA